MKANYKRVYLKDNNGDILVSQRDLAITDKPEYQIRKALIQEEINKGKVLIDRECFKHSHMDKVNLKKEKLSYNKLKNSVDFKEKKTNLLKQILNTKHPLICGSLIISEIR